MNNQQRSQRHQQSPQFPYPPPQSIEPTRTLKSLVNIRKESVRFTRCITDTIDSATKPATQPPHVKPLQTTLVIGGAGGGAGGDSKVPMVSTVLPAVATVPVNPVSYNIEFVYDADAKCAITIYYFCTEEVTSNGCR